MTQSVGSVTEMTVSDTENLKRMGLGTRVEPVAGEVGTEQDRVAWCSWDCVNWNPDVSQTFSISLERGKTISMDLKGRTKRKRNGRIP